MIWDASGVWDWCLFASINPLKARKQLKTETIKYQNSIPFSTRHVSKHKTIIRYKYSWIHMEIQKTAQDIKTNPKLKNLILWNFSLMANVFLILGVNSCKDPRRKWLYPPTTTTYPISKGHLFITWRRGKKGSRKCFFFPFMAFQDFHSLCRSSRDQMLNSCEQRSRKFTANTLRKCNPASFLTFFFLLSSAAAKKIWGPSFFIIIFFYSSTGCSWEMCESQNVNKVMTVSATYPHLNVDLIALRVEKINSHHD